MFKYKWETMSSRRSIVLAKGRLAKFTEAKI